MAILNFNNFIGQTQICQQLDKLINIKETTGILNHILMLGSPGMGKLTLVKQFIKKIDLKSVIISAYALTKPKELEILINNLDLYKIVVITDIEVLPAKVISLLKLAMKGAEWVSKIKIGATAKTITFNLPNFFIIGISGNDSKIPMDFKLAFNYIFKFEPYTFAELKILLVQWLSMSQVQLPEKCVDYLVNYSHCIPGVLLKLVEYIKLLSTGCSINLDFLINVFNKSWWASLNINSNELEYLKLLDNGELKTSQLSNCLKISNYDLITTVEPQLLGLDLIRCKKNYRMLTDYGRFFLQNWLKNKT